MAGPLRQSPRVYIDTPNRPRSHWRERIIEAERGLVGGFRADSALVVQFFGACLVLAIGVVLQIGWREWALVIACATFNLSAELFHQVLKTLFQTSDNRDLPPHIRQALGMASAAVFFAILGSSVAVTIIFGHRLAELF